MDEYYMKILVMNWRDVTHPESGGAEVYLHETAKRWVNWGHEVTLLCGKYEGCKEEQEMDGIEIIRKGGPYTVYFYAMKWCLRRLRNRGYDVVIESINGVPFFTPLYVEEPKIAIIHHLVKDIFFKELKWYQAVIGYASESIIPIIYRNIPFIAVSQSTKKDLIGFGIPSKNITVIYNGVDHELYKPGHNKSSYPHIVYLGRIKRYKSLHHLVMAMKMVVKELKEEYHASAPVKLLSIAGKLNCEELKSLSTKLRVNEYVEFLGEVSEEEKVRLLRSAWVYVIPSMREGWGLTVLEANACGTPAIATDVPGLRDAVIKNETGLLVPYGDVKALSKEIINVLTNDELRERLSRNAIKWSGRYNWDESAKRFLSVLRKVCSSNAR